MTSLYSHLEGIVQNLKDSYRAWKAGEETAKFPDVPIDWNGYIGNYVAFYHGKIIASGKNF